MIKKIKVFQRNTIKKYKITNDKKNQYFKEIRLKKIKNMNYKKIKVFQRNTINPEEIANLDY